MRYLLVFKITAKVLRAGAMEGYEDLHAEPQRFGLYCILFFRYSNILF